MSLDQTYEALQIFEARLNSFDERLRSGRKAIRKQHEEIDEVWQDSLRHEYDVWMTDFEHSVDRYVDSKSEDFEVFLNRKISQLRAYLQGG